MPAAVNWTPIDLDILRKKFDDFDTDHNGVLDSKELHAALTALGSKLTMIDLDKDGNKTVDFDEFSVLSQLIGQHTHPIFQSALDRLNSTTPHAGPDPVEPAVLKRVAAKAWRNLAGLRDWNDISLHRAFTEIDADGDGYLTPEEIQRAMQKLAPGMSKTDCMLATISVTDTNHDGYVSFEEWKEMMSYEAEGLIEASLQTYGKSSGQDIGQSDSTGKPVHHGTTLQRFGDDYSPW